MRVPALGDGRDAWSEARPGLALLAVCVAAGLAVGAAASVVHPLVLLALPPALAVVLWALSSAERALWLLIAVIAILPRIASPVSIGFKPTLLDVALLALIAAWVLRTSRYPLDLRRLPITLPLVGLMVVALAAFVFGLPNGPFTTLVARRFAEMLLSLGAVFVIVGVLRDTGAVRRATAALVLCGGLAALIGLVLYVMPDDLAIRLLSALRIFDYPTGPGVLRYIRDDPTLMQRATGLWIDPNAYGGFLLVVGALALPQVFASRPALPRGLALVCAGLIGLALVASVSRGAMLGFVAVAVLIGAARYRRLLVLGAIVLAVALILPQTSELISHFMDGFMGRDLATQMRFGEYKDALRLLERYPVFGVGFTDTPDVDLYIGVSMMYLLIAQTMGIVGLIAFLAVVAAVFVSASRAAPKVRSNEELFPAWMGAHAAIVGVLISGIFDHYFFNIDFHNAVMLMWLVVALAVAASRLAQHGGAPVIFAREARRCLSLSKATAFRRLRQAQPPKPVRLPGAMQNLRAHPNTVKPAEHLLESSRMEISVKPLKQVDIVKVSGRIDSATAPEFDNALKGLLDHGRRKIVIDCEGLEYVSSAGLRAMLAALKSAKSNGGNVVLAQANERVRDTLALVGFQTLFLQYTDIVDAVDSF